MLAISRVIGPEASGTGMVAIAAFTLLDVLGATIFTDAVVQQRQLTLRQASSALTGATLVGTAAALILALLAPWLAASSEAPEAEALCLALAPLLPISAFAGAASGVVLRDQRFALLASRVLLGQPVALGVGLWMAAHGFGAWAMIGNQIVATLCTVLLLAIFGRLRARPMLDRAAIASLWPIAGPQMLAVGVMVGRYRMFLVGLGMVTTEAVLGVSHLAFRMLDAVLVMVWQATGRIAMPRLCALQDDRHKLAEAFGDLAQLQALLGMPIAAGIALTAPDLIQALMGPIWYGAAQAAQIVGLAAVLSFTHGDTTSLFVARGRPKWNVAINAAMLVVPLVTLLILRPQTPSGAALAWASQAIVMPPVLTWLVLREIQRPLSWLLRRIAPGLVATAGMSAAVIGLELAIVLPAGLELIMAALVGGTVYVVIAWLMLGGRLPRALLRSPAPAAAE